MSSLHETILVATDKGRLCGVNVLFDFKTGHLRPKIKDFLIRFKDISLSKFWIFTVIMTLVINPHLMSELK